MPRPKKNEIVPSTSLQMLLDAQVTIIKECEQEVVTRWQIMAAAVKEIHAKRLWEENYQSFEHCMAEAIGWKKSWAYEMLKAAEVLEDAPITDASMARYLHPLDPDRRQLAWQGAVSEAAPAKPTREDVRKAASLLNTPELGEGEEQPDAPGKEEKDEQKPPSIVPDAAGFDEIMAILRDTRSSIEALAETPAGAFVGLEQIIVDMRNAYNALAWAKPHCVCVYCDGEGCKHCHNRGWMPKGLYASAPEEYKR